MRKFSFVLTMLALVLVFGLAFVSCGDDNGNNSTPGGQTPGGNTPGGQTPGGGAQGYLTLTDIPAAYNGKYMYYIGMGAMGTAAGNVYGCQNVAFSAPYNNNGFPTVTATCIQIANGRAVLPLWLYTMSPDGTGTVVEPTVIKFSSGVIDRAGFFHIHDSSIKIQYSDYTTNESSIAYFFFDTITLTNGSATLSCDDANTFHEAPR